MSRYSSRVSINEIAEEVGVSKATISRYLNGQFEYMSHATREKIKHTIEVMGYRPSKIARSLKLQTSKMIGCIIADISNPASSVIIQGISDVCDAAGYQVLFSNSGENDAQKELSSIESLLDSRIDGLIINSTGYNSDYLKSLRNEGMPIVLVDRIFDQEYKLDGVTSENYSSTMECIEHLWRQGYRHIGCFTGDMLRISSRRIRRQAFLDAMARFYSKDAQDDVYIIDHTDEEKTTELLHVFLEKAANTSSAIFASNGVVQLHLLSVLKKMRVEIGKDLGFCGFDDWGWAALVGPGITTVAQNSYQMGAEAARLLLERIEGNVLTENICIQIPNELKIRGSTKPVS